MSEANNNTDKLKDYLTEEDCVNILNNYLNRKDWTLSSYSVNRLSDKIEGFLGEHFIVKIEYNTSDSEANQRFFLKVLNGSSKFVFEMTQDINAYEKESFFYEKLLPELNTYGADISFAPRQFLCRPYLIVLEDMSTYGFKTINKQTPFDLVHTKVALKTLAKFHSASIAYEAKRRKADPNYSLLAEHPEIFTEKVFSHEENAATRWMKSSIRGVFGIIESMPETGRVSNETFATKLGELMDNIADFVEPSAASTCAVLHGDLWSNNVLFRYENEKPVESVIIDFQILKYGVPAMDVVQLLISNTRKHFRLEHLQDLLNYYYDEFSLRLKEQSVDADDILPKAQFLETCKEVVVPCTIQAMVDRATTFLFEDKLVSLLGNDAALEEFFMDKIGETIMESYQTNELFREVITEDICDVRDCICS